MKGHKTYYRICQIEKIISFGVTTDEFIEIQDKAKEKNMSISMYCKSRIFPESEFEKHYNYLLEKIKKYPLNIIFTIRDVFGKDWDNIPTGIKLAIGRRFFHY